MKNNIQLVAFIDNKEAVRLILTEDSYHASSNGLPMSEIQFIAWNSVKETAAKQSTPNCYESFVGTYLVLLETFGDVRTTRVKGIK